MADDLATDPEYIEACRVAAWAERPLAETSRHWDACARKFNFPDGWPEGVEPDAYVRGQISSAAPRRSTEAPPPAPSGPVSPSVRRLREMLR